MAILWQGRARVAGALPMLAAVVLWAGVERPAVLISDTGGLVGWMTPAGRALSKPAGESFAALNWLAHDGDGATQADAYARGQAVPLKPDGQIWRHETGRGAAERALAAGHTADVVGTSAMLEPPAAACLLLDRQKLGDLGAVAVYVRPDGVQLTPTQRPSGRRPWQGAPPKRRDGLLAGSIGAN